MWFLRVCHQVPHELFFSTNLPLGSRGVGLPGVFCSKVDEDDLDDLGTGY